MVETRIIVPRATRSPSVLYDIPDITIAVGETHDMSQYINEQPGFDITDSQVLNLNTNIATYDHATKLLTGVAGGTMTGLQYEVTLTEQVGTPQSFDYVKWGIPYLTDAVPSYSGATAPSGADYTNHDWVGNDPLAKVNPTWSGAADEYYVKYNGNDGTAGNSGRGTPSLPRATIPSGAQSAGTKVWVEGQNSTSGYDILLGTGVADGVTLSYAGTKANPCWLIGINGPRLGGVVYIDGATHLTVDGIHSVWNNSSGAKCGGYQIIGGSQYICVRNLEIEGAYLSSTSGGGAGFHITGTDVNTWNEFLCIYNVECHDFGDYTIQGTANDYHGFRPSWYNRWVWIVDCTIYNARGNGMQVGNSADPTADTSAQNPQFVYIAGNDIYSHNENAIACKGSYDIIIAKNTLHDAQQSGSPGVLLILTIDDEGNTSDRRWAIGNEIYNGLSNAVRLAHNTTPNEICGVLNNYMHDCTGAAVFTQQNALTTDSRKYVYNNTAVNMESFFVDSTGTFNTANCYQAGNVLYNGSVGVFAEVNNVLGGLVVADSVCYDDTLTLAWGTSGKSITATNSALNSDPDFVNQAAGNIRVNAGSPVENRTTVAELYTTFQTLYGIDIKYDFYGTAIPGSGSINAGAAQ